MQIPEDEETLIVREKALVRKLDRRIMPMLTILYICQRLDLSNIGNAKVSGGRLVGGVVTCCSTIGGGSPVRLAARQRAVLMGHLHLYLGRYRHANTKQHADGKIKTQFVL